MTKQKSILITGCSSGIGLCCAHELKNRGYRVFATTRKAEDAAKIEAQGLESLVLDLASSESINAAVDELLKRTNNHLYALFNNGAFGQPGAVEDLKRHVLTEQFEANVFGTQELTNRIIPIMRQQGYGRIIYNGSLLGIVSLPFRGAYNASKYALEGLADTLRLELYGSGIEVSIIEPGPITSAFRKNAYIKYQQNIDKDHSFFKVNYEGMEARLKKKGPAAPFTLAPEAVYKKLEHALESAHPRAHYYVTFPTHLFGTLKRLLPAKGLDWVLRKVSKEENQTER
ncbi:MAG: SDR family NAD(P)-dependent oxidoreductase [gamma proteobacterium symbiont of Bathyaustriella thionipta]|nr:SDR family NAD(P)-dependent oxidoreductase [gamma proteobacterium symbiont of Bathyaustriella thionipta]MCU7950643.1 SDR family NAD(P)-dependent oxidoreductase [gamma proteobacterium symbiont of Bathyaustriella thionipta]MCU7952595.1 SDR family NAD(P)-dependent oxidoreductase [gamma proteobacterium symbiont of Bathyaustriella thionipta]MCU7957762.1 SDR family NAD(P)-dependent oxidoreductase [gamma proteobacterium symbiont of Bathyaustriella thionipta]MCU7968547.1 SDR family NAD(P)-dependent 